MTVQSHIRWMRKNHAFVDEDNVKRLIELLDRDGEEEYIPNLIHIIGEQKKASYGPSTKAKTRKVDPMLVGAILQHHSNQSEIKKNLNPPNNTHRNAAVTEVAWAEEESPVTLADLQPPQDEPDTTEFISIPKPAPRKRQQRPSRADLPPTIDMDVPPPRPPKPATAAQQYQQTAHAALPPIVNDDEMILSTAQQQPPAEAVYSIPHRPIPPLPTAPPPAPVQVTHPSALDPPFSSLTALPGPSSLPPLRLSVPRAPQPMRRSHIPLLRLEPHSASEA